MVFATFETRKKAMAFAKRAFRYPAVKKVKGGWKTYNDKPTIRRSR